MIRKEALDPEGRELLRHERAILERLTGLPGVVPLLPGTAGDGVLLLADVGGSALERKTRLPTPELVTLARRLARVMAGVHARGVTHRDITPDNILQAGGGTPYLVGFTRATTVAETWPEFSHQSQLLDALPYLAPEQTGRTGRPVDQRADLYALGAVLYEQAVGAPPFDVGDPWRLIHDHLTRIPDAPVDRRPELPRQLSDIIVHLLAKEPDDRYQSADGLRYDLDRLGEGDAVHIGEHDPPRRLRSPSRLVGRDREIDTLRAAFAAALSGACPGLLVSGPSGVGKTSLANELRPVATAAGGWFVAGAYDQYRRDDDYDGVRQALRGLGRLLLAEPDQQVADVRERIVRTVGANLGLAAMVPEFATLLGVEPDPPRDPLTNQARAQRTAIDMLRAVASRHRPVVLVLDDLQWAPRLPLGFVDEVLSGETIEGLLLVCAYRDDEVDAGHPLAAMLSRWQRTGGGPEQLHLTNLPVAELSSMVAEITHLDRQRAADLTAAIAPATGGNPYDTVELLNALRRDRILVPAGRSWQWDPDALRHRLGAAGDPTGPLQGHLAVMPPWTRALLTAMACLGGRVDRRLLQTATGLSAGALERSLAPALDDGLLVSAPDGRDAVGFRHDRVRAAVLRAAGPEQERAVRLRLARRLAPHPDLSPTAAQQYLSVLDAVTRPDERRTVAEVLRRAAAAAKPTGQHTMVEKLLAAALPLMDPEDTAALVEAHTDRHAALVSLGRLVEADEVYRTVEQLAVQPLSRTGATLTQISSLTNRGRNQQAVSLGLSLLRQLGVAFPGRAQLDLEIDRGMAAAYQWLRTSTLQDDLRQQVPTEPTLSAVAALINRTLPPAFFHDELTFEWLAVTAMRMWAARGPRQALVGPASQVAAVLATRRGDHRSGRELVLRVISVSEQRSYEPATSQAHFLYALDVGHWFEPLEQTVARSRRARQGLIRGGDLQNAGYTYYVALTQVLEYAPTLDSYLSEVDEALAYAVRTGNDPAADSFRAQRQLVTVLRGSGELPRTPPVTVTGNPTAVTNFHLTRALAAALLGDQAELDRQTSAMMPLMRHFSWAYSALLGRLLRGMALAGRIRTGGSGGDDPAATELDRIVDWLANRAADAPHNVVHLLRLLEAERAWAVGEFLIAVQYFDAALQEVSARQRPWHRAFILERAGRFYRAHGAEYTGDRLLAEARQAYRVWGATAKVSQLDWAYPEGNERSPLGTGPRYDGATNQRLVHGTVDLPGVLAASRALSSETSLEGLRARLVEVLSTMTGATGVHLLLRDGDGGGWTLATGDQGQLTPVEGTDDPPVPMSAVRYTERTREPLVVADATRDDRFARDPYLAGVDRCSLLAVPVVDRGDLRAMLLLENRLLRGAFSAERLDAVTLVAGQLVVSLDNAMMYRSLEQKVAARTEELALANRRLEQLSTTDTVTGLPNRRRLEEILGLEWQRARRTAVPVGAAMIDIDHFKRYNDHYGHAAGDRALQRIARALSRTVRDTDLVARFGGEEFAVVMPDTDIDTATRIAADLHAAVTALAEPHKAVAEGVVTVSVGVAAATPVAEQPPAYLLELADAELYRAKRAGRNRVRVADRSAASSRGPSSPAS